jgi:N-methylhydantoinase A
VKPNFGSLQGSIRKTKAESRRKVWFNDEWFDTSVYWRDELPASHSVSGPAVIEEYDSTIVVPPNWECSKAKNNCLALERKL